jgi:leader peptidase (prepilin peptidase)/N-methyltransferase
LAGPFVGSFLGVLIRRLPTGRPVAWTRSACEHCGKVLAPWEMVPVLSYAWLRGRCQVCRAVIAPAHLAVELAALAVPMLALAAGQRDPALVWASGVLGWTLLAAGWIDAETFLLPDQLTLPLVLAGLGFWAWFDSPALAGHAAASAIGWGGAWAVARLYRVLRGRDGLGMGDAKLLAAGGAWLGPSVALALVAAAWLALGWAGLQSARGRRLDADTRLSFGPFLALGIWSMWLVTAWKVGG